MGGLLIAALFATAVQSYRASYWKGVATVLRLDLDKIKLASELAGVQAKAAKAETERKYKERANEADIAHTAELDRARAAADAYARTHRVRNQAAGRSSSSPVATPNSDGAEGAAGPGEDSVVLTRGDFDIMVENTVRLKDAADWAKTLNAHD